MYTKCVAWCVVWHIKRLSTRSENGKRFWHIKL
nr:MAG TPA: hypothetical protein [Caudoviricetes sp.]